MYKKTTSPSLTKVVFAVFSKKLLAVNSSNCACRGCPTWRRQNRPVPAGSGMDAAEDRALPPPHPAAQCRSPGGASRPRSIPPFESLFHGPAYIFGRLSPSGSLTLVRRDEPYTYTTRRLASRQDHRDPLFATKDRDDFSTSSAQIKIVALQLEQRFHKIIIAVNNRVMMVLGMVGACAVKQDVIGIRRPIDPRFVQRFQQL